MARIEKGQPLPAVNVDQKGEIIVEDGKTKHMPWSSRQLVGKVRVVQHMAGRSSAKEINEPLMTALKAANFPRDHYQTTSIVNLKDAIFGTSAIVGMMVENGKKEFPWSMVVVDTQGDVRNAWDLKTDNSAIAVLDQEGKVLFFKEGALTAAEITDVLAQIETALEAAAA